MDIENNIHAAIAAAHQGAAMIYHAVLATGASLPEWEARNPALGPLINTGLDYASDMLARYGLPPTLIKLTADDIAVALKGIAAADATVDSVATERVVVASPPPVSAMPLPAPIPPNTAAAAS